MTPDNDSPFDYDPAYKAWLIERGHLPSDPPEPPPNLPPPPAKPRPSKGVQRQDRPHLVLIGLGLMFGSTGLLVASWVLPRLFGLAPRLIITLLWVPALVIGGNALSESRFGSRRKVRKQQYSDQNPSYGILKSRDLQVWLSNIFWLSLPVVVFVVCALCGVKDIGLPKVVNDVLPRIYIGPKYYPYRIHSAWFCLGLWLPGASIICIVRYYFHGGDKATTIHGRHYYRKKGK